jgi:hypothetical protein
LNPIMDLNLGSGGSFCAEADNPLILRNWPGTFTGCDCSDSWNPFYFGIYRYPCSYDMIQDFCVVVPATRKVQLNRFSDTLLCATRSSDTFLSLTRPFMNGTCPEGMKICGSGSLNNQTCTLVTSQCPVNDIRVFQSPSNIPKELTTVLKLLNFYFNTSLVMFPL